MEDFEEVNFSHEGKEYYAKIEIDESNEWRVMNVFKFDEPEIWEEMKVVSAELTKIMVIAIEKYVSELDDPYVPSDYDDKDLLYDR